MNGKLVIGKVFSHTHTYTPTMKEISLNILHHLGRELLLDRNMLTDRSLKINGTTYTFVPVVHRFGASYKAL